MLALHPRRPGTRLTIGLRRSQVAAVFGVERAFGARQCGQHGESMESERGAPTASRSRRTTTFSPSGRLATAQRPLPGRSATENASSCIVWLTPPIDQSAGHEYRSSLARRLPGIPGQFRQSGGMVSAAVDRPVCEPQTQIANFNFGHMPHFTWLIPVQCCGDGSRNI